MFPGTPHRKLSGPELAPIRDLQTPWETIRALAGLTELRIHDIRHSHVSLLIEMGFSALAIAERMGHEAVDITYRYAHLFPTKQDEMAAALDGARG